MVLGVWKRYDTEKTDIERGLDGYGRGRALPLTIACLLFSYSLGFNDAMNETLLLMIGPVFHGGDVAAVPRYGGGGCPIRGSRVAANRSGEGFGARPEGGVAAAPFFSSLRATLCTAAYMSERQPVLEVKGRRWDGREGGRRGGMVEMGWKREGERSTCCYGVGRGEGQTNFQGFRFFLSRGRTNPLFHQASS